MLLYLKCGFFQFTKLPFILNLSGTEVVSKQTISSFLFCLCASGALQLRKEKRYKVKQRTAWKFNKEMAFWWAGLTNINYLFSIGECCLRKFYPTLSINQPFPHKDNLLNLFSNCKRIIKREKIILMEIWSWGASCWRTKAQRSRKGRVGKWEE